MGTSGEIFLSSDFLIYIARLDELKVKHHVALEDSLGGAVLLDVWAKPGAKKERIEIGKSGEIIIYINERPVEGKANKALIKRLGKAFGIPGSSIELDKGMKSKHKRFLLYFEFTKNRNLGYYLDKLLVTF